MRVSDLTAAECSTRLAGPGLVLRAGPFTIRLQSPLEEVAEAVHLLYGEHALVPGADGARFSLSIARPRGLRRHVRQQVHASFEGVTPFDPLPREMAPPLVEWAINWCIGQYAHEFLVIHSAAVERGGRVLMLPAPPGSGKSTLCAALAHRGWRLLSDEFTIVDTVTGEIVPVPRPIALKGPSLGLLRDWASDLTLGREIVSPEGIRLAYARPPADAVRRAAERAEPGWIVVPGFRGGSAPELTPIPRGRSLMHVADNAFNHTMQGERGFELLAGMVDRARACRIVYPDLPSAVALVEQFCADGAHA